MQPLGKALPFRTINDIAIHFQDKATCIEYITQLRWNGKPKCAFCEHEHVYELKGANKRYKCAKCRKHFSAIKGTIFENSTVPLAKWFMAIFIMSTHRKGISSVQVSRNIGVTQKTAWFMMQRVRNAFKMQSFNTVTKLGGDKVVEADECYLGGKPQNMHKSKRLLAQKDGYKKIVIAGAVERSGKVKVEAVEKTSVYTLIPFLIKNVHQGSKLMTDEHLAYVNAGRVYEHQSIKHIVREYVRGEVHTNTIENFWSLLKRGIYGTYHFVSTKHVQNYLEEFAFRFNSREITEAQRFDKLISLSNHRIDYATLTGKQKDKGQTKKA
ncbi:IS1595 family transposase [Mucilaginibacter ginsenosidivorans]|uniref:IS1595 family transposase n=1 Tax=Mucilaginibacter ginsenosidivorans TaxID=398053 RepID=A0A5B8V0X7_9SPHI|nr:IS1595 family transposase [Mucilaginibacter ginsenosidivorans]QEC65167.1 IS1595 family transposase [Mucilaginibacter ginsenosidivorans]